MNQVGGVDEDRSRGDHRLLARLVAGDQAALAIVYDQYASLVFGIARRVTCDEAAAADVTQDVFVLLWEQPDRVDLARGSLRTFLATVARRRAIDLVRRSVRRNDRQQRLAAQADTAPPDVAEAATAMLEAERVRKALEDLPPDQRRAVELAYFEGLTYRQVAQRLEIPEGTAKSRLRLALARLAGALRDEGRVAWN